MRRKHTLPVGDRTRNQHLLTGHWLEAEIRVIIRDIEDEDVIPQVDDVLDTLADRSRKDPTDCGVPTTYDSHEARSIAVRLLMGVQPRPTSDVPRFPPFYDDGSPERYS